MSREMIYKKMCVYVKILKNLSFCILRIIQPIQLKFSVEVKHMQPYH